MNAMGLMILAAATGAGVGGTALAAEPTAPLAFPGAEGYGKFTVGGRGGAVLEVTTLDDAGPGSLRAAVEAKGPRTVVFRVSGVIGLKSPLVIRNPNITIAGQTAPGDGVALKTYPLVISADEVILRHLRLRLGGGGQGDADALSGRFHKNLIIDHVSASWSVDEVLSVYHMENVTVQWSIISESLYASHHVKGHHGFGGIWGSNYGSYHHNLIAHNSSRNPRLASGSGATDFRNNVIYNWGYESAYGGEAEQPGTDRFLSTTVNMVANYFKPGPATQPGPVSYRIFHPLTRAGPSDYGRFFIADNVMVGSLEVTADNWRGGVQLDGDANALPLIRRPAPWPAMAIVQQTAQDAYGLVLAQAGATKPRRDAVDTRIVRETREGVATFEGATYKTENKVADPSKPTGIIDTPETVGGWPDLKSAAAPVDADHDGMADSWERAHGLDPADPADRNRRDADGYTMLEVYLNGL